jgi:hypothetical protein
MKVRIWGTNMKDLSCVCGKAVRGRASVAMLPSRGFYLCGKPERPSIDIHCMLLLRHVYNLNRERTVTNASTRPSPA